MLVSRSRSALVSESGSGMLPLALKVDEGFVGEVAAHPDAVDWWIGVSDKDGTRSDS
jgi:hypothetical protein